MKKNVHDLPDFDAADYLDTPEDVRAYLDAALEEHDPAAFLKAVGTVARAQGAMAKIAEELNIARPSLYRSLDETGNPSFATVFRVLDVLGIDLATKGRSAA